MRGERRGGYLGRIWVWSSLSGEMEIWCSNTRVRYALLTSSQIFYDCFDCLDVWRREAELTP